MATILLCGVDLYFRAKLEASLPDHHVVTTDSIDVPDLVNAADLAIHASVKPEPTWER